MYKTPVVSHPARPAALASRAHVVLLLLVAGALAAFTPRAEAQTTGSLDGIVHDTTGALVPGAKVELINEQSKAVRSTASNGEGYFTINAIQPNTYDLVVSLAGFESYRVNGIQIHPNDSKTIAKIALKIGEITQEVTVSATTAGVSLDSGEKSALISADDIQRLSTVGRDATELIKFLPGFALAGAGLSNGGTAASSQTAGFGSSSVSSFSAVGSTPQTGATTVLSDGASVTDPGDLGASIQSVNIDSVQEIKVSTAAFGADTAKGPVVINAIGKSGGSSYHGSAYLYARNTALNANDWYSNFEGQVRPPTKYFFPGATVGGPVKIPGTDFNHSKKLTFFAAFELYNQTIADNQATNGTTGLVQAFIPTQAGDLNITEPMITPTGLDLSPGAIANALGNIDQGVLAKTCPTDYTTNGVPNNTLNGSGGICYNGNVTYTQQDCMYAGGQISGTPTNRPVGNQTPCPVGGRLPIDPRSLIFAKFWPKPNRIPQAVPSQSLLSDGYNYEPTLTDTNNGYQWRARVDENFTDSLKLYVTYNYEKVNSQIDVDNVFYAGSDVIPYPTPAFTHTYSHGVSLNLTKVVGASLTNELIAAGTYFYSPNQLQNRSLLQDASTGWSGGRYFNDGALQLPGIRDYENGVPGFAMGYFPAGSAYLRKFSYDVADNLSKQLKRHSLKFGVYAEVTANNQVPYNYTQGLYAFNHYNNGCTTDDGANQSQFNNGVANFAQGCGGFSQANSSANSDLHFHNIDFYGQDEWKTTKKLTLTLSMRLEHLGAWFNPDGLGLAVWTPPAQHVLYNVTQDPHTFPGISWHQTDASDPISGQASRLLFYSPRFGLAYDLYGNGKTTLRGGWGAYRFHDSYNDSDGPLSTTLGIKNIQTNNQSCTYDQVAGLGVGCSFGNPASDVYAFDKSDDEQPLNYSYQFSVDQAMPGSANLEISYVGNQSHHTFTEGNLSNQNYIPLGGLFQPDPLTGTVTQPSSSQQIQQDYRPYPNYVHVYVPHHIGYGNYNSLQVSYVKQKGPFIYTGNYTWSKALGIRGDYRTGVVGDPSTLRNNYGYLGFNRNNAVNFTFSWQVGHLYKGNRFVAAAVDQWEFSGITSLQSGADIAVLSGNGNLGLSGGANYTPVGSNTSISVPLTNVSYLGTPDITLQPVVTCDPRHNLHNVSTLGHQYINGQCFALPKLGTNGDFELPDLHGPAYFSSDLTVKRTFKINEHQNLQFSLAGFNFLNHPLYSFYEGQNIGLNLSFGLPAGTTATNPSQALAGATENSSNFGYTPYKQGFRIVELGARYNF